MASADLSGLSQILPRPRLAYVRPPLLKSWRFRLRRSIVLAFLICAVTQAHAQEPAPAPTLTLAELLARIDVTDPALRASLAATAQAESELISARAFPRTEVELRTGRATNETSSRSESEFSIRQPLDVFNRRGARREGAEAQVAIERASAAQTRLVARGVARSAYIELLATDRALTAAREDRDAALQVEQLVNRRADLGETREVDRLRIQVERQRAEDRLEQLELARISAERLLRLLAGSAPLPERLLLADVPAAVILGYDRMRSQVVAHQPRIEAAAAEVRRQEALLALARANRWPDPSLGAFIDSEIDKRARGVVLGVSLPLSGRSRGEIAVAVAALDRARADRDAVEREVTMDFNAAFHEQEALIRHVARLQNELLPRARHALDIADFAYRQGETSQLDYLDARRTYVGLQQETLDAVRQSASAGSRLEQLTGEPLDAQSHQ
jgi:cobalt-zinc-cadmium efflux system outer membrane protein